MLRSIARSVRLIHAESKSTRKIGSSFTQIGTNQGICRADVISASRRSFSQGQNGWRQSSGNGNQYNATFSPSSAPLIATVSILGTTACGLLWLAQAEDDRITSIDSLHDATKWYDISNYFSGALNHPLCSMKQKILSRLYSPSS
jgi:hypothetical protein